MKDKGAMLTPNDIARSAIVRAPLRKRGERRFELLLNSAEELLVANAREDVTLADIAANAGVPLPSVYHFFSNKDAVLIALAGRYHRILQQIALTQPSSAPQTWQQLFELRAGDAVDFLNRTPGAMRLFISAGIGVEVRNLDLTGNRVLSEMRANDFRRYFECDHMEGLQTWMEVCMGMMDGIWAISYADNGYIAPDNIRESMIAATAYLRCYLPEYLQPKSARLLQSEA